MPRLPLRWRRTVSLQRERERLIDRINEIRHDADRINHEINNKIKMVGREYQRARESQKNPKREKYEARINAFRKVLKKKIKKLEERRSELFQRLTTIKAELEKR